MRRLLSLALLLLSAGAASAQVITNTDPYPGRDSTYLAAREVAGDLAIISILQQNGRYVYDLDGGDETTTVLFTAADIVARSEVQSRVLFMLEPFGPIPATYFENAYFLTPEAPARVIRPRDAGPITQATLHRVRILVCTAPEASGGRCPQWTEAEPLSGGDGLQIYIVDGPELGGVYNLPPPPPPPSTGGRQKTTTD